MKLIYKEELSHISIGRKVAETFLEDMEAMIEVRLYEFESECTCKQEDIVRMMKQSLIPVFSGLQSVYESLRKEELTGIMRYVYISFLRTAVVTERPVYRFDLYDKRGCASVIECAARWECKEIFHEFYKLKKEIEEKFQEQSKIKEYILEKGLLELAETMHVFAEPFIAEAIKQLAEEKQLWGEKLPEFMIGEFLDKSDKIIGGDNGIFYN